MKNILRKGNILIPGAGGFAAINAIKALRMIDFEGKIITTDSNPLSAGFYLADKYYVVPKITDPGFFERAIDIIKNENIKIILPTSGFDIIPYSENSEIVEQKGAICYFSSNEVINLCNDKYRFYNEIKNDFPTPRYWFSRDNIKEYPVFIKPRFGKGSRDTFLCKSKEELQKIDYFKEDMLYCEYLPGKEYTVDVFVDLKGNPICAVPRERIETKAGISFKGRTVKNTYIEKVCLDLAKDLQIKGPVCMQLKEDKYGKFKFIEVNPRMGGGTIMTFLSGINFLDLILKDLLGNDLRSLNLSYQEITVLRYYEEVIVRS